MRSDGDLRFAKTIGRPIQDIGWIKPMPLTVARFDLDETVPIPNVPRTCRVASLIPTGFPYLFDEAAAEPIEPVLLFLFDKYASPADYVHGRWTKDNSASAAASDLKDWWAKIQASEVTWDCADNGLLASWLMDMKAAPSGATGNWLDEETIRRRLANVNEFYRWALRQGRVERVPASDPAKAAADQQLSEANRGRKARAQSGGGITDPHPISTANSVRLAEALGPLPSEGKTQSSRTRLAYEFGLETGMRIDEALHLPVAFFADFRFDAARPFIVTTLRITRTKGLVPRDVQIPAWLMHEISLYIDGERAAAVEQARRTWLGAGRKDCQYLLLNHAGARHNAGKQTRAATIDADFNKACKNLGITSRKVVAAGSAQADTVEIPRHTFHDTRHTFAVAVYHALEARGYRWPWIHVQQALGHANVSTTVKIYLKVIDDLGDEAREGISLTLKQFRSGWGASGGTPAPQVKESN